MPEYRRKLPHFHPDQSYLFITWRLFGTLPRTAGAVLHSNPGQAFAAEDRELAMACGPVWLKKVPIAYMVSDAILAGETQRHYYELEAWVVMPNHLHMLILPRAPVPVLMRWLKGSTARGANQILDRTERPFWQPESYDHCLRNASQIGRAAKYIEQNPVVAGLVPLAEQWPRSSAGWAGQWPALPDRVV